MSRFVAGFITILYVCAVSGQPQTDPRQRGPPEDKSIILGVVSGGRYPDGAFSINYGNENGPRIPYAVNVTQKEEDLRRLKATNDSIAVGVVSGADFSDGAFSINYGNNNDNGPPPNYGVTGNTQYNGPPPNYGVTGNTQYNGPNNGQGFVNGNNDLGNGQNPPYNPYGNKYNRQSTEAPVKNSATRHTFLSSIASYLSKLYSS